MDSGHSHHQDPYEQLGFGFRVYFRMIFGFIFLFTVLSLIMLPAMYIFNSQHGLDGTYNYVKA